MIPRSIQTAACRDFRNALVRAVWDVAPRGQPRRKWLAFARRRGSSLTLRDVAAWTLRFGVTMTLEAIDLLPCRGARFDAELL